MNHQPPQPEREQPRPVLMMVSDVVPNAQGNARQRRAWQLLTIAHRTHDVHLAAYQDHRVNLLQWRSLSAWCQWIHLEPGHHHCDHLIGKVAIGLRTLVRSGAVRSPFTSVQDLPETEYDALLVSGMGCALPGMLPESIEQQARMSVLALHQQDQRLAQASRYDVLVTADAQASIPLHRGPILVLPEADTALPTTPPAAEALAPNNPMGQGLSQLLGRDTPSPHITVAMTLPTPRALAA